MDTSLYSEDPIMIAEAVGWLQIVTGADGITYWHDKWSDTFESTMNDEDIRACGTVGTYQGRTQMANLRDVRDLNSGGARWIIHICPSALVELPPMAVNLLQMTRTILFIAPHMYKTYKNVEDAQPHTDSFSFLLQSYYYWSDSHGLDV